MEQYDETGKVICILCGKAYHQITPQHLKKEHDMTIEDFKSKYPDVSLTGLAFRSKQKYKYSDIFDQMATVVEEVKIEDREDFEIDKIPSIPKNFQQSVTNLIEEVNSIVNTKKTYPNPNNSIHREKLKILDFLLTIFPNDLQNSYFIEKRSLDGYLQYRLITDICIPSKKIVIEFPNTFWHNQDMATFNKYNILQRNGWKIVEIPGVLPSKEEIKNSLIKFNLI